MNQKIKIVNLNKCYGEVIAVKGLNLQVKPGQLFAFLGPNGAGKSTTIDIICTLLKADSGTIQIDEQYVGKDDNIIRKKIGAVFQTGVLDELLSVEENLAIRGSMYGLHGTNLKVAIMQTAQTTGIVNLLKRPYGKLSGGQKRRCDIARALIHTPEILFLDEPTTGLDPQTRQAVWETIQMIQRQQKMTVFLTTHYMEEAARADYVVVIDNGEIVAEGTPSQLKDLYAKDKLIISTDDIAELEGYVKQLDMPYIIQADSIIIDIPTTKAALPILEKYTDLIDSFEVLKGTMDDAFIAIIGKDDE